MLIFVFIVDVENEILVKMFFEDLYLNKKVSLLKCVKEKEWC